MWNKHKALLIFFYFVSKDSMWNNILHLINTEDILVS